jgi:hypothetical protein
MSIFSNNHKCEVYSFGVLLWEIAEERIPFKDYDDPVEIALLVCKMYREPFSENNQMPREYKSLAISGM